MSKIAEDVVEGVVSEVSERMAEPAYAQVAIGAFVQAHPDVGRYITAHLDDLGGGEAVMHAVFHAEVLNECYRRHLGRHLSPIGFAELDAVSTAETKATLEARQPALASYLASNLDSEPMQVLLAHIALTMDDAS